MVVYFFSGGGGGGKILKRRLVLGLGTVKVCMYDMESVDGEMS